MNNTIIGGGIAGAAGLVVLTMAFALGDRKPDVNFDYKKASVQEQAQWLTSYGKYILNNHGEELVSQSQSIRFESVDPQKRAMNFRITSQEDENAGVIETDKFKKLAAELSNDEQARLCKFSTQNELLISDSLIQMTVQIGEQSLPPMQVSKAICDELGKKPEVPKSPLGS